MPIDINSLFADIIDTPEQRQQKLLQQGMVQGQLLSSGLRGRAAALAPLAQMAGQLGVQRQEDLRRAVQPMLGIDPRTTGEKMAEQLKGLDPDDPTSLLKAAQALQSIDPVRAASLRQMSAQKTKEKLKLEQEEKIQDLQKRDIEASIALNQQKYSQGQSAFELQQEMDELALQEQRIKIERLESGESLDTVERDTYTYPNGLSISTTTNNKKIIKDINNNVLTGEAATLALQEAQQNAIEFEQRKAGAKTTGKLSAEKAVESFDQAANIRKTASQALAAASAIAQGADTNALERFLDPFNQQTQFLQSIQGELTLGTLSTVTLGALSEAELTLLQQTAAPTGYDKEQVRQWYIDKSNAMIKAAEALEDQAMYFNQPNASVGGWLAIQRQMQQRVGNSDESENKGVSEARQRLIDTIAGKI